MKWRGTMTAKITRVQPVRSTKRKARLLPAPESKTRSPVVLVRMRKHPCPQFLLFTLGHVCGRQDDARCGGCSCSEGYGTHGDRRSGQVHNERVCVCMRHVIDNMCPPLATKAISLRSLVRLLTLGSRMVEPDLNAQWPPLGHSLEPDWGKLRIPRYFVTRLS